MKAREDAVEATQYETTGKCDRCDAKPGQLVNHLVPCACWSGLGASMEDCECPFGYLGRKAARKVAQRAQETAQPPQVSSREPEGSVSAGVGRESRTEVPAQLGVEPTPRP